MTKMVTIVTLCNAFTFACSIPPFHIYKIVISMLRFIFLGAFSSEGKLLLTNYQPVLIQLQIKFNKLLIKCQQQQVFLVSLLSKERALIREGCSCLICWPRQRALIQVRLHIRVRKVIRRNTVHADQSHLIFQII